MIDDLSRTLEAVLEDDALEDEFQALFDANVAFDRPYETFAPDAPASLDLFRLRRTGVRGAGAGRRRGGRIPGLVERRRSVESPRPWGPAGRVRR